MKKLALILCLLPVFSYAATNSTERTYQDLCAKEQDPVKRQNYCHVYEDPAIKTSIAQQLRVDTAIG